MLRNGSQSLLRGSISDPYLLLWGLPCPSHDSPEVQWSEGSLDLKGSWGTHMHPCGKERKAHQHLRVPNMTVKLRCLEIDKDMAILIKLLEKVKTSAGHLTQRCQHRWSDRNLHEEWLQRKRLMSSSRPTSFLFDGVTSDLPERLLLSCTYIFIIVWRAPWENYTSFPNTGPLEENAGKSDGICLLEVRKKVGCAF